MKTKHHNILLIILLSVFVQFSCSEYLEKTDYAVIEEEKVFREFNNYQGYVETMYAAIVIPYKAIPQNGDPNTGDDMETTFGGAARYLMDGNYLGVLSSSNSYLYSSNAKHNEVLSFPREGQQYTHTVWGGWKAIRAANIALKNLHLLENGTQEELDLLAGQAYFFRAYFHWEIMRAWGAIPYVKTALTPDSDMRIPVLNFHQTAELVLEDFQKAVELLPIDWDLTAVGNRTPGNNAGRLTKGMALSFQAEVMLWCASPMVNGTVTKNYVYDEEYCKRSAAYAWEVIKMANEGIYALEPYATIDDVFYSITSQRAGKKEKIFSGIQRNNDRNNSSIYMNFTINGGGNNTGSPSASYVENYGMAATGLPIHDPESGYDPNQPFVGRDPRFYHDLRLDRSRLSQTLPLTDVRATAQLYEGGRDRGGNNSRTGYGYKKFIAPNYNSLDGFSGNVNNFWFIVSRIRLAEIYLFYAEAVNEAYGPGGTHPGANFTAIQAVNVIRTRAGVPDVHSKYTATKELFRERIRNERAVELAFEIKRWYDIRRWYIAHLPEHKTITQLNFDKDWTYFNTTLWKLKVFELKHYWMPFPNDQVSIYKEWPQNPGW
jgi:starch-binding outer membrane protein, SusD/RagB family